MSVKVEQLNESNTTKTWASGSNESVAPDRSVRLSVPAMSRSSPGYLKVGSRAWVRRWMSLTSSSAAVDTWYLIGCSGLESEAPPPHWCCTTPLRIPRPGIKPGTCSWFRKLLNATFDSLVFVTETGSSQHKDVCCGSTGISRYDTGEEQLTLLALTKTQRSVSSLALWRHVPPLPQM